ncbi:MAG TPA: hypothetical protein VHE55_05545 [Fimbriimonadaceae bacterium]|nr:hypothetical protein [Fimbriimonadaceae bacterium]
MPLTIKTLRVTVRVKSRRRESPMHEPARPERPSLEYAMPVTEQVAHGDPDPNKTATLGRGAATGRGPISARNADPNKIADRVYELMKREIILGKHRGGLITNGRR